MKTGKQFWVDKLGEGWTKQLKDLLKSNYGDKLINFLSTEYALHKVAPDYQDIFKPFKLCPWESLRIVILDSEVWVNNIANGLAYGSKGEAFLYNADAGIIQTCIEKQYHDGKLYMEFDFTLESWAQQGILLINRNPTVRTNLPNSHQKQWNKFTSAVLNTINEYAPGTIFVLWGKENQSLKPYIKKHNYVLEFNHPKDYLGKNWDCPNFKEIDEILYNLNGEKIKW